MGSIVVGTDGSAGGEAAVWQAARLAGALGEKVVVVSAYGAPSMPVGPEAALAVAAGDGAAHAEEVLARVHERLAAQGVAHDTRAVCASAADALCEVARVEDAETIVVGSRGMRGAGRLLGSVPNTVSHKAPCNVMIVRTD